MECGLTQTQLHDFCKWFAGYHGTEQPEHVFFVTCLYGHFHTYPKAAESLLRDMRRTGLVEEKAGTGKDGYKARYRIGFTAKLNEDA